MKNKNRKIDVIVKYFYPVAAGIETNILETYSVLVKKGWDVTIHTSNIDYTTGELLDEEEDFRGLKIKRYPLRLFWFWPKIDKKNTSLIALHNFNVLPHFFIMLYAYADKLRNKKNYSLFLTPHGGFNPEWRVFNKFTALIKSIYHFTLGALLINLAVDGVRSVSEWEKEEMIKRTISPSIITTIPNGIENEAYLKTNYKVSSKTKKKVKSLGKYIIQIGRIYPIKNYETVIKALPEIDKDINFVIMGPVADVKYLNKLKLLAKKLKVHHRVKFIGVVRGADKFYYIKKSQMMVHMAMWESFCNVVHEALSQGKVCIVANNTALPLLVKDNINGYTVETQDHVDLAKKVNTVYEHIDSAKYKIMSNRNRKFGLMESWENVAEKMHKTYLKLI